MEAERSRDTHAPFQELATLVYEAPFSYSELYAMLNPKHQSKRFLLLLGTIAKGRGELR